MEPTVIVAVIGAIQSVGVAAIGALIARSNKRRDESERDAKRISKASYGLQFATAEALDVVLRKVHGDHINGECEEARARLNKAKGELNEICNEQLADAGTR